MSKKSILEMGFNTTLVWVRPLCELNGFEGSTSFQYNACLGSTLAASLLCILFKGFNTTLVWVRLLGSVFLSIVHASFNTTLVWVRPAHSWNIDKSNFVVSIQRLFGFDLKIGNLKGNDLNRFQYNACLGSIHSFTIHSAISKIVSIQRLFGFDPFRHRD